MDRCPQQKKKIKKSPAQIEGCSRGEFIGTENRVTSLIVGYVCCRMESTPLSGDA